MSLLSHLDVKAPAEPALLRRCSGTVTTGAAAPRRRTSSWPDPDIELDSTHGELLARCSAGDTSAFSALYRDTSSRIYGLVLGVLHSPEHAAEVAQEVFLEVWRQSARYDAARGSVQSWMATIAHRRAVDRVRTVTAVRMRDQRYAVSSRVRDVDAVWDSVASHCEAAAVRDALGQLTACQREALVLAYFGGHTHTQIATLLGLPVGTVKTRIRGGLTRLRNAVALDEKR
jgi:RNA polymerase sigma-70 factor (ECF subfamily)